MESQLVNNRLTASNKSKTINPALKFSSNQQSKSVNKKEKKEEKKIEIKKEEIKKEEIKKNEKKIEEPNININSITNNNNSHNIYVINNYFEDSKKSKRNSVENFPVGLWKDGKRYDRSGIEIKKGGKQKLSFMDKIGKGKLVDTIAIESFKEYNLIEEVSDDKKHSCCYVY